ncbi:MAG: hypothetical protein ACT4PJ_16040 [Gemmatimonadaceae bacterium]
MAASVILTACSGSEGSPTAPRLGLGNDPDRIKIFDQQRTPFTATVSASCNGEPVVVSGTMNTVSQAQDTPSDNVHFRLHTNLQGVSGVGAVSGNRYRLSQVHNVTYNYEAFLDPPRFETTQIFRYRLVGQRPDNNTWFNVGVNTTVTPDGRITSTWSEVEGRCGEDG